MNKTLTIQISNDLYNALQELYDFKGEKEINEHLVNILREAIEDKRKRINDPIFEPIITSGSGYSDTAEKHDTYIYGLEK